MWFRQDLRLSDNPALNAAVAAGNIMPIYILDDVNSGKWSSGSASRVWLHHSLQALNDSLDGHLQLFRGDARIVLRKLTHQSPVKAVYWNRCYEPWRIHRDQKIKIQLNEQGIEVKSFNASLLWEPWQINKSDGTPYKVFTPFYQKGCLSAPPPRIPQPGPTRIKYADQASPQSCKLVDLALLPDQDWQKNIIEHWQFGEKAALIRLDKFCDQGLNDYRQERDFPALDSTSRLSPYLHTGEISPNQVWYRMDQESNRIQSSDTTHYQRELVWREFSYHLLYRFPELPEQNLNSKFDKFEWMQNQDQIKHWHRGLTGYPIVDAGMRELWQTGYMHNRVRMIVASFLIKNMLVHWREGCRWFWDCLVDADLANNSASWQWCAGSGADAAPYFRIFNPVLQSKKFDPDGEYIARYVPELADLAPEKRHEPWLSLPEPKKLSDSDCGYPRPILDLKETRARALSRYQRLS